MKKITLTALMVSTLLSLSACQHITLSSPKTAIAITQSDWAKDYVELLNSNQTTNHKNHEKLRQALNDIRINSGATYAYVIAPVDDANPHGNFMLTIDGSEEPDDWGTEYKHETQFTESWQGQVALARSAWQDEDGSTLWSAFAPIYHNGQIVGLLGLDYPADDVISKHPEWNRDDPRWNGFTNSITGKIPPAIQQKRATLTKLAQKYAKELNRHSK